MENETTTVKKKTTNENRHVRQTLYFRLMFQRNYVLIKIKGLFFLKTKYEIPEGLMYVKLSKYENWL